MRLPIDTGSVKFAAAGPSEPVLDYETRAPKLDENGIALLISVEKTALLLGIGRTQIYNLIAQGAISSVKIGRRRLVVKRDLDDFVGRLFCSQNQEDRKRGTQVE
jgi:excisionase family DNA binding protein